MLIDFSEYKAVVTSTNANGTHFVKVSFPCIGLYVSGIRVVTLHEGLEKYKVYQPKLYTSKHEWKSDYEMANESPLWQVLVEAATEAVKEGFYL